MTQRKAMVGRRREKAILPRLRLLLLAVVLLASCDGTVYHRFEPVDSDGWAVGDTLLFMYDGGASVSTDAAVAVAVQLRYAATYKYKDVAVRVETSKPGGEVLSVDTLCCAIYGNDGRRLGSTAGTMYQRGSDAVVVPAVCTDTLFMKVSHIMDEVLLPGIFDVGIKLVNVKP